jgi:hypothetical protein
MPLMIGAGMEKKRKEREAKAFEEVSVHARFSLVQSRTQ